MAEEDQTITLARVAERAERFDEMSDFMEQRIQKGQPLNPEERDMFSAAFKNALTERRHAVRVAVGVAAQEADAGADAHVQLANGYKSKVEAELRAICNRVLTLLSSILVPASQPGEERTFYLKMKGDYHRYLAEFAQADLKAGIANDANGAYAEGTREAGTLPVTHPVRLGLALNFSVFQHEVMQDTNSAITTATKALQSAAADLDNIPEASKSDAVLTMQLLQDNLGLWRGAP
jgi:14-3-3 protein epsilon